MRHIPETISAALVQGAVRFCHAWIITRSDGERLGFTDHDRDLTVLDVVCKAATGLTQGAASVDLGMEASDASVSGVLTADALDPADIRAGLYDGAAVESFVVEWSSGDPVTMGAGTLARIEARGGVGAGSTFVAHVEGAAARLQRVIGRRFTPLCDAVFGDARCGAMGDGPCDKRYATCHGVHGNALNFRGFPDLPGEDFVTLYPRSGDVMDGRSRSGAGRA
ncbi:DUF2163 domain-containing protein [Asticcacaulis sp. YBE204]|uniref:DUF2163 domain-containing protein n=1 Tax=Asticcacaulis sp. YBE204 TaxID=1282363 RepID=UPI0003C3E284|nr:DUF2163 domain-containing protein [Asticcacaulis sp. YBE204]ESQ79552.1 hypothetical protein AEYBE204_06835 [Asticcacaulis sp. YBE204]